MEFLEIGEALGRGLEAGLLTVDCFAEELLGTDLLRRW